MVSWRQPVYLLSVCVLTVGCGGTSPSAPSVGGAVPVRRVVVLGDSLSVSPSMTQAFPTHLQAMIDRDALPWTVTNAGISGDTTVPEMNGPDGIHPNAAGARRIAESVWPFLGRLLRARNATLVTVHY